ncbi:MAG: VWA domain-containing protein, partial [Bacteroidota bacterium]
MNPLLKHLYRFFLLIALAVMLPISIIWGQNNALIQPRILFLVDGSSSMLESWQANQIRFKAAGKIIDQIVDSIYKVNPNVEFGLRVYGHQHTAQENNCFDTKLEVPFGKSNATQLFLRMNSLKPLGVSPIAYSLKEAAENDLINTSNYNYSLILITDGGESCNGNICEVVKLLLEKKIKFQPYIIGLINYQPLELQYACLGTYLKVTNDAEATLATNTILQAYKPKFLVPELKTTTAEDYLSGLKATMNEIKPINKIAYFKIVIAPIIKKAKLLSSLKPILIKDTSSEIGERKIDTIYLAPINSLNKLPYVHLAFENTVLKPNWLSTFKLLVPETPSEIDSIELAYITSITKPR